MNVLFYSYIIVFFIYQTIFMFIVTEILIILPVNPAFTVEALRILKQNGFVLVSCPKYLSINYTINAFILVQIRAWKSHLQKT